MNFFSYVKLGEANGNGQYIVEYKPATKPLCGESHEEAKWFEHPKYGHKADIGVLDVTESLISTQAVGANKLESNACLSPQVGQDAFVIGFPFGMNAIGAPAPVWKRASIALEPTYDPKGLPYILVDTATRPGMSGSLTLARHVLSQTTIQWKDGTTKEVLYQVEETALGVYSGRLDNKLDMAQLGMVWDIALVDEIIEAGILAKPTSK